MDKTGLKHSHLMKSSLTAVIGTPQNHRSWCFSALVLLFFCAGAAAQDDLPFLDLDTPLRLDFSGSWEKDFRRSDTWRDELNRMMRLRQEQAAGQRAGTSTSGGPAVSVGNINLNSSRRSSSIVDMARLAEYISRQTTMTIIQDRNQVRIERDGEAPLVCSLDNGIHDTFTSPHGKEMCVWDRTQLVFTISLPDDLEISHRFSVSTDRELLRLVTSIQSKRSAPFNLIQAFTRYDAQPDDFNCVQTLSRGNVCSKVTPLE
jgi:hypothetical protein